MTSNDGFHTAETRQQNSMELISPVPSVIVNPSVQNFDINNICYVHTSCCNQHQRWNTNNCRHQKEAIQYQDL